MYEIAVKSQFSAAHTLEGHPGRCSRLHGHTWVVELVFRAERPADGGMVADFEDARRVLEQAIDPFDHRYLNEVPPFDAEPPTAENVARVVYERAAEASAGWETSPAEVTVWEAEGSRATYRPG